jgi:hypothetical protein
MLLCAAGFRRCRGAMMGSLVILRGAKNDRLWTPSRLRYTGAINRLLRGFAIGGKGAVDEGVGAAQIGAGVESLFDLRW